MNLAIFTACDSVIYVVTLMVINRLPRKKTMIWGIVVEAISLACLLVACLKDDWVIWRLIASVSMRSATGLVIQVYYLYTAETFPTAMRQAGLGTCSIFARFGSTVAPFVKELNNYTHLSVSVSVFLTLVVVNLLLILFIPDTGKIQMADTIGQKKKEVEQQAAAVGQRSMSITSALSFHS